MGRHCSDCEAEVGTPVESIGNLMDGQHKAKGSAQEQEQYKAVGAGHTDTAKLEGHIAGWADMTHTEIDHHEGTVEVVEQEPADKGLLEVQNHYFLSKILPRADGRQFCK